MARHVEATHRIVIPLPLDPCQALFTPEGEARWVEGWSPTYLHPAARDTMPGMVLTTGEGEDRTYWTLVDYTQRPHRARYVRTTPGTRTGTVEVTCEAMDPERTAVTVTYAMTALSEAGERALDDFEGAAYRAMIESWRDAIETRLPQLRDDGRA